MLMNGSCNSKGKNMESIKGKDGLFAVMNTSKGDIVLELFYKDAPLTVCNFVGLAEGTLDAADGKPFYDGLKFHRVIEDFMIQGGDPKGNGTGGPGYKFADEEVPYVFDKPGYLAMANAGANTNGSQFFITHVETPWLNGKHTIFGRVVSDDDQKVVNLVKQNDLINSIKIIRQGEEASNFGCKQSDWDNFNKEANEKALKAKEAKYKSQIDEINKKYPNCERDENGIFYKIKKEGSGDVCGSGKKVYVAYKGYLLNGNVFDSSEGRGDLDFTTGAGQMIPGFDIMVQSMKKGETRTIILPPDMAYGERGYPGVIPAASYICFDVTLNKF